MYEGTSSEDQDATVVVSGGTKSFENSNVLQSVHQNSQNFDVGP